MHYWRIHAWGFVLASRDPAGVVWRTDHEFTYEWIPEITTADGW